MKRILLAAVASTALVSGASAADFIVEAPAEPVPIADWTGVSIGAVAGYGWANTDSDVAVTGLPGVEFEVDGDGDGFLAGGSVGADVQLGSRVVVGALADIYWSDISADGSEDVDLGILLGTGTLAGTVDQNWGFDILARAGFLATESTLVYALGGYSQVDVDWEASATTGFGTDTVDGSDTLGGWTVGGGVETRVTSNLSVKAEYRYTDFESLDFGGLIGGVAPYEVSTDMDEHRAVLGLNWRFGNL